MSVALPGLGAMPPDAQLATPSQGMSGAGSVPSGATLAREAYSSLRFQALEDAAVWSRLWIGVGFAADIPSPGDILPYTAGHHGIHIERATDGGFVGRFNKAQHGGCRVVPLQCRTGAKTRCSFTACGHSRDRRPILSRTPDRELHLDQYLGLRPERLLPVAVKTYGPLLLARLDPEGEVDCRWPLSNRVFGCDEDAGPAVTVFQEFGTDWKSLAIALGEGGHATTLFPNVVVRPVGAATLVVVLQPVALDRTLCRIRVVGPGGRALDEASASLAIGEVRERAEQAEAMHDALRHGAWDLPCKGGSRARFEADIHAAIASLGSKVPADVVFRTDAKDIW